MTQYLKERIKEKIEERFGSIDNYGAYADNGTWVSTQEFYTLVCEVIDENSDVFESEE